MLFYSPLKDVWIVSSGSLSWVSYESMISLSMKSGYTC